MQLTIDPNDDLNDVLRVVAALYDVRLEVADNAEAYEPGTAAESGAAGVSESGEFGEEEAGATEGGAEEAAETPEIEESQPATRGRRGRGAGRAASRTSSESPRGRGRRGGATDVDTAAVRSWARENGYQVSDRGRISSQIIDAYLAAQG